MVTGFLYWLAGLCKSRSYQYTRRDPEHPEPEGTIYFSDPLMNLLSYAPMLAGILIPIVFGWWWIGLGLPLFLFGLIVFLVFSYNAPPQSLLIRKFLGGPEFFMDIPVFVLWNRFMEWEIIPGLQVRMESDGQSAESIHSMMKLRVRAVGEKEDEDDTVEAVDSNVAIKFSGSILFRIDLNRPHTVMVAFFDDFRLKPKDDDMTDQEDLEERCNRLFRSIVVAACDTVLQQLDWEVAVRNIGYINLLLEQELPKHLHDFPLIIQKVLLEEAFGEPITQRNRQAAARLEATTASQVAVAKRDQRQSEARANADAVVTESEEDRRGRIAKTAANLAAAMTEQRNLRKIAGVRLQALERETQVAAQEAQIAFAQLAARLRAVGEEPLAAVIDGLVNADPTIRVPVYQEFAKSMGTAPAVGTAVNIGPPKMDTLMGPALLEAATRAAEIFGLAKQVASQTPPATPPVPPAPTTP